MSYPRSCADSRESASRESAFKESAAMESGDQVSMESASRESASRESPSRESPSRESTPPLARCGVPAVRIVDDGPSTSQPVLPPPRPSSRESVEFRASLEEALASLEERYTRQLQRRSEPTPAVVRAMSYPRVRAGFRETTSRESTPPLNPPGRACPGKPPDEAPGGASVLRSKCILPIS